MVPVLVMRFGDDGTELDKHIVKGGVNCSTRHCTGVAGAPSDLDRMSVGVREECSCYALFGIWGQWMYKPRDGNDIHSRSMGSGGQEGSTKQ